MSSFTQIEASLKNRLAEREANGSLRMLRVALDKDLVDTLQQKQGLQELIDFSSNDYLGFARSEDLKGLIRTELSQLSKYKNGSGGSRLLTGNTEYAESIEQFIADYHYAEAGLLYNSGYDANLGFLSCIPQKGDTIISDELIHASLIDGCRLSLAHRFKFKHNNLEELESKLKCANGNIFVVVESVYSMDGDLTPLKEISSLCEKYNANLIVDEAHAIGLFGLEGKGLSYQLGLHQKTFARIVTFGKALGAHGAIILGSKLLRQYLINFSRPFIYTTAAPMHNLVAIKMAYRLLAITSSKVLFENISYFKKEASNLGLQILPSSSAIQGILSLSNENAKKQALYLQKHGFDIRPILHPTVAVGKERLRICIHQYNTEKEISSLLTHLSHIVNE